MDTLLNLKGKIIKSINSERLAYVIPYILEFAEKTGRDSLRDLCINELYGYQQSEKVPEHRKIPVTFYDISGKMISRHKKNSTLRINELFQFDLFPFNGAIDELENLTIERDVPSFLVLNEPYNVTIEDQSFKAYSFEYIARYIQPNIRKLKQLLLTDINKVVIEQQPILGREVFDFLHPIVTDISSTLFLNGHYRQAILDSSIELINQVKEKSGLKNLDNTPLMQKAFSSNNPILKLSDNKDEQLGFMWLFSGAVMTMRNINAHKLDSTIKKEDSIEQLYFISYLFKILDRTEKL